MSDNDDFDSKGDEFDSLFHLKLRLIDSNRGSLGIPPNAIIHGQNSHPVLMAQDVVDMAIRRKQRNYAVGPLALPFSNVFLEHLDFGRTLWTFPGVEIIYISLAYLPNKSPFDYIVQVGFRDLQRNTVRESTVYSSWTTTGYQITYAIPPPSPTPNPQALHHDAFIYIFHLLDILARANLSRQVIRRRRESTFRCRIL